MTDKTPLSAALRSATERSLTPDEARAYLELPVSDDERRHALALIHWFQQRYPTPLERLRYVRSACARWRGP